MTMKLAQKMGFGARLILGPRLKLRLELGSFGVSACTYELMEKETQTELEVDRQE